MQQSQNTDSAMNRWAGASTPSPHTANPLPTRIFFRWLLAGLAGFVLLTALYFYLERRASRQIIYLRPDNALGAVRADGTGDHKLSLAGLDYMAIGRPQWAPQGGRFASIIQGSSGRALLIASSAAQPVVQIPLAESVDLQLLSEAWAPSGKYVVIMNQRGGGMEIQIADLEQQRLLPVALPLADQHAFWHPQWDQLLVTTLNEQSTQTIQIVTMDGQARALTPDDGFKHHSEAVWSPDGAQVAYIASANLNDSEQPLFIANANGSTSVKLALDGQNSLPIWAPRGDLIIFTRYNSATNEHMLYRVQPDGEGLAPIGRGLPPNLAMDDPQSAISWSPDRSWMIFQSLNPNSGQISLSLAGYDGSKPSSLIPELAPMRTPFSAIWSPTSRGVLVATDGDIWMRWLNREELEFFARGAYPHWEP